MPKVLITGANRGLGLEFARQYKAAGWMSLPRRASPARNWMTSELRWTS
jgi:NAD(P)-dependent dehydrogenase (short-subunit alcohol dehydrogenase family)